MAYAATMRNIGGFWPESLPRAARSPCSMFCKHATFDGMMKADPKPEPSPFERLRDFARRIVAVPKAEIDEQEAEYQRTKTLKKERRAANHTIK